MLRPFYKQNLKSILTLGGLFLSLGMIGCSPSVTLNYNLHSNLNEMEKKELLPSVVKPSIEFYGDAKKVFVGKYALKNVCIANFAVNMFYGPGGTAQLAGFSAGVDKFAAKRQANKTGYATYRPEARIAILPDDLLQDFSGQMLKVWEKGFAAHGMHLVPVEKILKSKSYNQFGSELPEVGSDFRSTEISESDASFTVPKGFRDFSGSLDGIALMTDEDLGNSLLHDSGCDAFLNITNFISWTADVALTTENGIRGRKGSASIAAKVMLLAPWDLYKPAAEAQDVPVPWVKNNTPVASSELKKPATGPIFMPADFKNATQAREVIKKEFLEGLLKNYALAIDFELRAITAQLPKLN